MTENRTIFAYDLVVGNYLRLGFNSRDNNISEVIRIEAKEYGILIFCGCLAYPILVARDQFLCIVVGQTQQESQ